MLHRTGDFAGAQTPGADVDMLGRAGHNGFDPLHIGLPGTIGAAVGVGHLVAKDNALAAEFTLGHLISLLAGQDVHRTSAIILPETKGKCKPFFSKSEIFRVFGGQLGCHRLGQNCQVAWTASSRDNLSVCGNSSESGKVGKPSMAGATDSTG